MSNEDLYVEVARQKADIAKLQNQVAALENTVYQKQQEKGHPPKTTTQLPIQDILKDLDVALSDRLEVVAENEVRAREYLQRKDDWTTVNKLLKQHGFKWVSQGKESCWRRQ